MAAVTRLVVYVVRGGAVEAFTVEGGEAEELLERLAGLEARGLAERSGPPIGARVACHGPLLAELAAAELVPGGCRGCGWLLVLLGAALGALPPERAAWLAALVVCEKRCRGRRGCVEQCVQSSARELLEGLDACR